MSQFMPMSSSRGGLQLSILPAGVLVERDGRAVVDVDVSRHRIVIRARGQPHETHTVTSIGLMDAACTVASILRRVAAGTVRSRAVAEARRGAPRLEADPTPTVQGQLFAATPSSSALVVDDRDALIAALKGQLLERCIAVARRRDPRIDKAAAIVDAVLGVGPPPLLYSEGVLLAPYLIDDIVRFRAAAVVVAMLGRFQARTVASCHGQAAPPLSSWRSFLAPNKVVTRALDKTVAALEEPAFAGVSAAHIWQLRRIDLIAPVSSPGRLTVLGERSLVGGPTTARDLRLLQLVDDDTLDGLRDDVVVALRLQRAPAAQQVHTLCIVLQGDRHEEPAAERLSPALRLRRLVRRRLQGLATTLAARRAGARSMSTGWGAMAARPPIPLPDDPGIRFLATADDYVDEGERMHHCVALHFNQGCRGQAFIFHVDDGPTTVHIDRHGALVQARGRENVQNEHTHRAGRRLAAWGAPLRLLRLGPATTSVWLGDGPTLPAGTQPLRLLGDVVMALAAAATRRRPAEVDAKVDDADDDGVDAEVDAEVDDLVDDELEVEVDVEHWRSAVQAAQQGRAWLGVDGGGVLVVIANDGIPS
jgi:hypothetical protein